MRKFEQPTLKSCTLATVLTWRTHLSKTYIHLIVLIEFVSREISRTDYFHVLHVSDFTHILVPSGFESKYRTKSSTVIGYIARCIEKKYMKACLRVHHTLEIFGSYSTRRRNRARALNVRSGSTLPRRHEKIFDNDIYRITSLRYIEFGFCCNIVVTRDGFERFSSTVRRVAGEPTQRLCGVRRVAGQAVDSRGFVFYYLYHTQNVQQSPNLILDWFFSKSLFSDI